MLLLSKVPGKTALIEHNNFEIAKHTRTLAHTHTHAHTLAEWAENGKVQWAGPGSTRSHYVLVTLVAKTSK